MPIRRATLEDAPAVAGVHVRSWREAYAELLPAPLLASLSVDDRTARRRQFMSDPSQSIASFVATDAQGTTIVGFGDCGAQRAADLTAAGFTGEFLAIYVLRMAQRSGIGRALMAAMAQELIVRGHSAAAAWVLRENLPAQRFYEALGAVLIGKRLDRRPDVTLDEVGYGWRDIRALTGISGP